MKNPNVLGVVFFILSLSIFSCKKDSPIESESQFVGKYVGDLVFSIPEKNFTETLSDYTIILFAGREKGEVALGSVPLMNAQYGRIEGNRIVIPLSRVDHGGMEVVEWGEITLRNSEIVVFLAGPISITGT